MLEKVEWDKGIILLDIVIDRLPKLYPLLNQFLGLNIHDSYNRWDILVCHATSGPDCVFRAKLNTSVAASTA